MNGIVSYSVYMMEEDIHNLMNNFKKVPIVHSVAVDVNTGVENLVLFRIMTTDLIQMLDHLEDLSYVRTNNYTNVENVNFGSSTIQIEKYPANITIAEMMGIMNFNIKISCRNRARTNHLVFELNDVGLFDDITISENEDAGESEDRDQETIPEKANKKWLH